VAVGLWSLADLPELIRSERRFEPRMPERERKRLLSGWRKALERAKGWAEEEG
jgi:glycerol kinase